VWVSVKDEGIGIAFEEQERSLRSSTVLIAEIEMALVWDWRSAN
jgi:hypothetical protein